MARVATTIRALTKPGHNFTDDSNFETLATGTDNGRTIVQSACDLIFLKNDTGGAAVFTVKAQASDAETAAGIVPADNTISVATAKSYTLEPSAVLADANGLINIDCDVAAELLAVTI
jgi:hypothetical protein